MPAPIDPIDERDEFLDEPEVSDEELIAAAEAHDKKKKDRPPIVLPKEPLFQTLFRQSISRDDVVLHDFADHVVGPLSDRFGTVAAKGGAFFREKEAEHAKNTDRYQRDQTLRGHLINGMLPALRIARTLYHWNADPLRYYGQKVERLFIAGFMLHDYTKIPEVKITLTKAGFTEMEAPSREKIPALERIFAQWCDWLGLDDFLQPVGGSTPYIQDLIYIAHNTQVLWGTMRPPALLPNKATDVDEYELATQLSHLADLLAYVAPTPRELVADKGIRKALLTLTETDSIPGKRMARLTYHHIAENRGLLLNFIQDGALAALTIPDQREPLLYAPSGVVYLERYDAPAMLDPADLTRRIVASIRDRAGSQLIATGKGAKRGNVGLQADDSYNDFFSLPEFIRRSPELVARYIVNNKSPDRLAPIRDNRWPGGANIPDSVSSDPKDARLDQIAEWIGLIEVQFRDRIRANDVNALIGWLLDHLGIADLADEFQSLRSFPAANKGGIKYWWFWAAAHALSRKQGIHPEQVLQWLNTLAQDLAADLPDNLPSAARVNESTWEDLTDYVGRVLTLGGAKTIQPGQFENELSRYSRAKGSRGKAACAICGSDYVTRKPTETTVSFQPGVYTGRLPMEASNNARNLCSICALEQLLRQLFMRNLDAGGKVDDQRVRYLSFYPSYFFTPETLNFVNRVYQRLSDIRISDKDLMQALKDHALKDSDGTKDPGFWQRLEPFLMRAEADEPSKRIVRFNTRSQATFLMIGLRGFNKPSDAESWILPAFLALLLPICLDVKVVVSESSIPLMVEADELPETVWFDGAHAAIRALIGQDNKSNEREGEFVGRDRINVDEVLPALQRLAAAYVIHLETEYAPPKEQWQRLTPIANALTESPLYVFHYLNKQERDGKLIGPDQVHRYVRYAKDVFNPQGDPLMSLAQELVQLYRGFYRAKNSNSNSILRPLSVVSDALLIADPHLFDGPEALIEVAYGELARFMDRVSKGLADGRFPKGVSAPDRELAMRQFCDLFVRNVFIGVFRGDVAALRGKQLNLLRSACEALYRDKQRIEWDERKKAGEAVDPDEEVTDLPRT